MKKTIILTLIMLLALSAVTFATPGDTNDPIVVLSYLNDRFTSLISQYNLEDIPAMKDALDELNSSEDVSSPQSLEVVEIKDGERIIAGAGTEIILRGGEAFIIGSELGGLSDVTMGKDFVSGMAAIPNHLMIVPRDDGRGVYTDNYAIFMVRGSYEILK